MSASIAPYRIGWLMSCESLESPPSRGQIGICVSAFCLSTIKEFKREPALPQSAFVPAGNANLNQILCLEEGRTVAKDNTVVMNKVRLQIDKQPGRASCAGLRVIVRKHLDNTHTVWWGTRLLGRYNAKGKPVPKQVTHSTELQASNRIPVAKASSW